MNTESRKERRSEKVPTRKREANLRQEENMKMIKGVEKMIKGEMIRRSQKGVFAESLNKNIK